MPDFGPTKELMARLVNSRGQWDSGNINLFRQPLVLQSGPRINGRYPDSAISTVRSMSFQDDDGKEVLVPTVSPEGQLLNDDQAIDQYYNSGRFLGKFISPEDATNYGSRLHEDYQNGRFNIGPRRMTVNGTPIEFSLGHIRR